MSKTKRDEKMLLILTLAGALLFVLCASLKCADSGPLIDAKPKNEDYIRVAPGGGYFVHVDGSPFIPIGYNHNPNWPKLIESNPERKDYNPKVTEEFFAYLHRNGVNLVRLMIETPGSGCLEDPIGTFRPDHVRWIDHMVTSARKAGIRLMITPWDTFWMNHRWGICPYNSKLGGPVVKKIDFITKPEVIAAQKKRLKYMIDRWGNTGTIFAWELLNEADIWWGASPEQIGAWTKEMAAYVKDYERKKWGRNHMLAFSTASPRPKGPLGDVEFRQAGLDFATTHLYIGVSRAPTEPIGPALTTHEGVTFALGQIKDRRPYLDGESGPIDKWISDESLDNQVFHNMSWAHLASGGAGSGLRWPYRHPHYLTDDMYHTLSLMSRFVKRVPWAQVFEDSSVHPEVKAPDGRIAFTSGSAKAGIIWSTSKDGKSSDLDLSLTWSGGPSRVKYLAYDTKTGSWISPGKLELVEGKGTVHLVGAPGSVAIILEGE